MRLVSWNCNDNLDGKAHELRALEPDIAVIAECAAHLDIASEPNVTDVPGPGEIKGKSIGVLGFGDWTVEPGQAELEWVLPVTVSGSDPLHPPRRLDCVGLRTGLRGPDRPGDRRLPR